MSRPSRRSAFTLIELLAALAGASLLLIGMSSAVFIATRAADTSRTPATATLEAHTALGQMLADIQFAQSITEQVPTAITVVVPDRDLDATPETVRYAWSGTPGDPLTRQYNGGTVATLIDNVHVFQHDLPLPAPNLLSNPGMESGVVNWEAIPGASILNLSSPVHSGSGVLEAWHDTASDNAGARQDVTSQLINGTPYEISAWLTKLSSQAPFDAKLQLRINSSGGGEKLFATDPVVTVPSTYLHARGTVTPTWSGTLLSAYWEACGVSTFKDLYVDDAVLRVKQTTKQDVNISLQVGSDPAARLETAVTLLNEAL